MRPSPTRAADVPSRGVRWNAAAFAVVGACGVAINVGIARWYGAAVLGGFNSLLALFIVASQIGAAGVHSAVLYHAPIELRAGRPTRLVLISALAVAAAASSLTTSALGGSAELLAALFRDDAFADSLRAALLGFWLFPINKTLLNFLNGVHRVRAFACGTMARYVVAASIVAICGVTGAGASRLGLSLSISEAVLTGLLLVFLRRDLGATPVAEIGRWGRRQLGFGLRALPSGVVSELNTRIDVLLLGSLAGPLATGVYSLASIFAEGLYQLVMVLRMSFDATIAALVSHREWDELERLVARGKRLGLAVAGVVGVLSVAAFPLVGSWLIGRGEFDASWPVYGVLALGILAASPWIPFTAFLQQAGHPGAQSVLFLIVVSMNAIGNVALIPIAGALGAAIATAASQVVFVLALRLLVRRRVGFSL